MAAVAAQGIAVCGPWFTHHRRMPSEVFDFEIGVPVATTIAAAGRVKPSQWPALRVARTVYHGPYEGLALRVGRAHGAGSPPRGTSPPRISGSATSPAPNPDPIRPAGARSSIGR